MTDSERDDRQRHEGREHGYPERLVKDAKRRQCGRDKDDADAGPSVATPT